MAYLCVNKDGKELICRHQPKRWGNVKYEHRMGALDRESGKRYCVRMANNWETPDSLKYWLDMGYDADGNEIFYNIGLPEGSIEKLIGRKLTWEDEPVDLYGYENNK